MPSYKHLSEQDRLKLQKHLRTLVAPTKKP